jgi:hypothetical protein
MSQFFEGLTTMETDSMQKILVSMMDTKGIETKTEVEVPMALAQLHTMAMVLESAGVTELAQIIKDHIIKYLTYQVSRDREGRKEVFGAITEGIKEERKLRDKLTTEPGGV